MEELRNEIISNLRSCLISTKGKITLKQLQDDYRLLLGGSIPFTKLGFRNLESFLASVPSLVLTKSGDGQTYVDAKVDQKSAHISDLVRRQKSSAPKKKSASRTAPRFHAHPPTTHGRWQPKKNAGLKAAPGRVFNIAPRLNAVAHKQFIGGNVKRPEVASRIVVVPQKQKQVAKTPSPPPPRSSNNSNNIAFAANNSSSEKISESLLSTPENKNGIDYDEARLRLTSARKRISKIMSELTADRDSGNSSPTTDYECRQYQQEFVPTGDPVIDLKAFVEFHKLGELEIKFTETRAKKAKMSQFHCKIKVATHTYSSYPEDFFNAESAQRHAAQKALDDLIPKHSRRKSLLISSNDDIIDRIPPMLEKHQSAVWMWQMEADYIERYNEQLPSDWLQVIDSSPFVSIEKCPGGYVLKFCNPDDKGKKMDFNLNTFDVSVPSNTVQFSDQNRLYAIVIWAPSAMEIWCQQSGTPEYEAFFEMIEAMNVYYNANKDKLRAKNIHDNSCYVVLDENGYWIRVRALSTNGEIVDCFCFDNGRQYNVAIDDIYVLKREFAVEQAQAFVCRLVGLEDLYDSSFGSTHIADLEGREIIIEMLPDESDSNDLTLPIVMYDTNGVSINEELIRLITTEIATPHLNEHSITEVHVSNIESSGDCFVQIHTPAYLKLQELMESLQTVLNTNPPNDLIEPVSAQACQDRLYLIKFGGKWLRALFVDWAPNGLLAQVYFVDYGNAVVVNLQKDLFYPLDKIDSYLSQYPYQAIKVRIVIETVPADLVEMAKKLMPPDQPILLKITTKDNEEVPWVEFFKRSTDGGLFCINKSIMMEAELKRNETATNDSNEQRKRIWTLVQSNDCNKNVPSGGSLSKPPLPDKGQYLNIKVPFAVNPWNFFVQPLDSVQELTSLMAEMQLYYNNMQFSPLQIEDVIPGKIYASKHDDGSWYRTSVLKVIHSTSISVFYCDFGYYTNLTLRQLVPLNPKYMELPYQALKAKLAGIKPSQDKWTMEDCEVFKNLVTGRHFVSVLMDIEKDELYRSDIILKLQLIDTTGDDDVHIKEVLIRRGIAVNNVENKQ